MKEIIFEEGFFILKEELINEMAKEKGIELDCRIEKNIVKIKFNKKIFGLEAPIEISFEDIETNENTLKFKKFSVKVSNIQIPNFSILPLIKKYKFLALDVSKNEIYLNLKEIFKNLIYLKLEKIEREEGMIKIKIKKLIISL